MSKIVIDQAIAEQIATRKARNNVAESSVKLLFQIIERKFEIKC